MAVLVEEKPRTQEEKRTEVLYAIASHLADRTVDSTLEAAVNLLDFLQDIEDKTADDIRKVKTQQKYVELVESQAFSDRVRNVIAEQFSVLSDAHLTEYLKGLVYEEALAEVQLGVNTALAEIHNELEAGFLSKPTLQ